MENPLVKYYEVHTTGLGKESREQRAARERAMTAHGKERGMIQSINLQHVILLLPWCMWMVLTDMEWGNDRVPGLDLPRRAYIDTILAPAYCGGQVCGAGASVYLDSSLVDLT